MTVRPEIGDFRTRMRGKNSNSHGPVVRSLELLCHSEGAEIRVVNERLRNLQRFREKFLGDPQGIPHIVLCTSCKESEPALSEANVFGMTIVKDITFKSLLPDDRHLYSIRSIT
jgi:hypothetical protein